MLSLSEQLVLFDVGASNAEFVVIDKKAIRMLGARTGRKRGRVCQCVASEV
jgi:hypothetical protein